MELALNLAWLVCVLVFSGRLWWRLSSGREHAPAGLAPWQSVVTLACALAILFPVISMTDDLHDQQCLFEETRPLRGAAQIRSSDIADTHTGGSEFWVVTLEPAQSRAMVRVVVGRVEEFAASPAVICDSRPSIGRAPPLSPA